MTAVLLLQDSSASTSAIVGKGAGGMGTRGNDGARQTGDTGSGGDGDTSNSVTHNLPMAPVVAAAGAAT